MALPIIDVLIAPLVFVSALIMKSVRKAGVENLKISLIILDYVGILPVRNHFKYSATI